jgi:hypothetical protein
LAKARLPEGVAGIARLHAMIGRWLADDAEDAQVKIGIETDRSPWVQALIAAGYAVFAVNPLQAARCHERLAVSGAKAMPRTRTCWPTWRAPAAPGRRRLDGGRDGQGRHPDAQDADLGTDPAGQRLRHVLWEYFPAALTAFEDLDVADTLEMLAKTSTLPATATR